MKYGALLKDPNRISIDAEATLSGPLILNLTIITYAIAILDLLTPSRVASDPAVVIVAEAATLLTAASLLMCGVAIFNHIRPLRLRNLVWIPLVFAYWLLQTAIAARTLVEMILRKRTGWVRTEKTGSISPSNDVIELCQ